MKIEEKDYLKAQETIRLYEEQRKKEFWEKAKALEERYKGCDHEYKYTNRTWGPVNEMRCVYCGHTID